MNTKIEGRLDEMRRRIDALEAKGQAAHGSAKASIEGEVRAVREHVEAADAKVELLRTRLESAEHAVAAELAEDRQAFSDAMQAYLDDFKGLSAKLSDRSKSLAGSAREQSDAALSDIRQSRDAVAERLGQVHAASGERWRDGKASVAAARAELERKADAAMKKLK